MSNEPDALRECTDWCELVPGHPWPCIGPLPVPTAARPGGWVPGIGWVALLRDLPIGSVRRYSLTGPKWARSDRAFTGPCDMPVIVVEWPDDTAPVPPSPFTKEATA